MWQGLSSEGTVFSACGYVESLSKARWGTREDIKQSRGLTMRCICISICKPKPLPKKGSFSASQLSRIQGRADLAPAALLASSLEETRHLTRRHFGSASTSSAKHGPIDSHRRMGSPRLWLLLWRGETDPLSLQTHIIAVSLAIHNGQSAPLPPPAASLAFVLFPPPHKRAAGRHSAVAGRKNEVHMHVPRQGHGTETPTSTSASTSRMTQIRDPYCCIAGRSRARRV